MKRAFTIVVLVALLSFLGGCQKSMHRDVKRLAHKTSQCFSKVSINDPANSENEEFNECYDKLEELMSEYDKKYSTEEEREEFGRMYLEELNKSDLPQEFREQFNCMYELLSSEDYEDSIVPEAMFAQ